MEKEYFPFIVGDKISREQKKYINSLGETYESWPYMEITAIGRTLFLAVDGANERLYSKLNEYEKYEG